MYVLYYASMLRCWHLIWILVRTDHPFLGVGCHTIGQGVHTLEFFSLGLSGLICQEERSILEVMCGLLTLQRCHYQEQLSTPLHRHLV
jgi:hypothetical protein